MHRCASTALLLATICVAAGGCSILPAPVVGTPLARHQSYVGLGWGTSYGPARGRAMAADGTIHEVRGNGDHTDGGDPSALGLTAPVMLEVRYGFAEAIDVGVEAGWTGAGAGIRGRLNSPNADAAYHISFDARFGAASHMNPSRESYSLRLLLDSSIPIDPSSRLVGAIGISSGLRQHGLSAVGIDPPRFQDNTVGEPEFLVLRPEVRVEGAIGAYFHNQHGGVQLLLMPYVIVSSHSFSSECVGCGTAPTLTDFSQSWGFTVMIQPTGIHPPSSR